MLFRFVPLLAALVMPSVGVSAETPAAAADPAESGSAAQALAAKAGTEALEISFGKNTVLKYQLSKPADSKCLSPSACYIHPLTTPSGVVLTDIAPEDHPHHRGAFLAWLEVRDAAKAGDFWGWGEYAPLENRLIRNVAADAGTPTKDSATLVVKNDWLVEGSPLLKENLRANVIFRSDCGIVDLDWRFDSTTAVTLPQHAFSGFALRTRKDVPLSARDPSGPVNLPAPSHLKPESDWPARPWYALELALKDGGKAGVAILNHPANPKTLWHIITGIGLLNPCITAPGPVVMKPGAPLRLRYRVVTFDGPVPTELLNKLAGEFSNR